MALGSSTGTEKDTCVSARIRIFMIQASSIVTLYKKQSTLLCNLVALFVFSCRLSLRTGSLAICSLQHICCALPDKIELKLKPVIARLKSGLGRQISVAICAVTYRFIWSSIYAHIVSLLLCLFVSLSLYSICHTRIDRLINRLQSIAVSVLEDQLG